MDPIIQERFGYDDIEFVFLPRPEPDEEKQAKIHDMRIRNGEITINEARDELGLEPVPDGDTHMVYIGAAVIPLNSAVAGHALPMPGGEGPSPGAKSGDSGSRPPSSPQNFPQRGAKEPGARTQVDKKPDAKPVSRPAAKVGGFIDLTKVTPQEMADANSRASGDLHGNSNAQLHAGNYPHGHISFQGLPISIENAPGSIRGHRDGNVVAWQTRLPAAYGYIRGTVGADGDQLDVLIGKDLNSQIVFVSDQNKLSDKKKKVKGFDEHKVFLGYSSLKAALRDYLKANSDGHGPKRLGTVVQMSVGQFKDWLRIGETHSPIEDQRFGQVVLENGGLRKADTISSSTGLSWYDQTTATPKKKRKKRKPKSGPRWLQLSLGA